MSLSRFFLIVIITLVCGCCILAKSEKDLKKSKLVKARYRIMFWNVENYFDTQNDSLTNDDEFTPDGIRRWNYTRYLRKVNNLYKVLVAAGDPYPPEIIGLCEVENRQVLDDLIYKSPFSRYGYKAVHRDSKDKRGIDVAVLYNPQLVKLLNIQFISPYLNGTSPAETREIIYIEAVVCLMDTIHFYFNHWPSKYGGAGYTEPLRKLTAGTLKTSVDSLQKEHINPKIIIGGDFNDSPEAVSITQVLGAGCVENIFPESRTLYNLSCGGNPGTLKYQGIWGIIDQFIVTGNMLPGNNRKDDRDVRFSIFAPEFLLVTDEHYSGLKPFRTWDGMKYIGGFSDHLPVMLTIY